MHYNPAVMRSRPLVSLLLTAALLAGQWLAAGHDPDHRLSPGAGHVCAVCLYAHGAGSGVPPSVPRLALITAAEAPAAAVAAAPRTVTTGDYPIRGPPRLL